MQFILIPMNENALEISVPQQSAFLIEAGELMNVDYLVLIAERKPTYVGFVGFNSERLHDAFDEICCDFGIMPLTTWYSETDLDTAFEEFVIMDAPLNSCSGSAYIVERTSGWFPRRLLTCN